MSDAFQRDEIQQWSPESLAQYFSEERQKAGGVVNETKTLTLSQFLKARLDEYERIAKQASDSRYAPEVDNYGHLTIQSSFALEDIMSKRAIVDLHARVVRFQWCDEIAYGCDVCKDGPDQRTDYWPCPTLRLLAVPYRRHPDFREEWS